MNGATFGALATAKTLLDAGFEDRHAESAAGVVCDSRAGLATKADLDAAVSGLESRLEAKIERGASRTLLAVIAVGGIVVTAIIASAFAVIDRLP